MNAEARAAAPSVQIAREIFAAAPGVLWLTRSQVLVAADVHFGYEDVIGGALPAWSIGEIVRLLHRAMRAYGARELVLLGDVIHGNRMSEGTKRAVRTALGSLASLARLTVVAGNHEGRSRGTALLGNTVEYLERDGWILLHGDRVPSGELLCARNGWIIGHLHPSLRLGPRTRVPAFLAAPRALVLPALTPYSNGLDAASGACLRALEPFGVRTRSDVEVVAVTDRRCYPFGPLERFSEMAHNESISHS